MARETFARLLPDFAKTRLVFLQGWGEPFLNPLFFEMALQVKRAGSRAGVATNGMLIDEETATDLVRCGVDIVAFSLAGTDEKHDLVRRGTRLEAVLGAILAIRGAKERLGNSRPAVHIAYMLLRSCLDDLYRLPRLLAGTGVHQVVVSTLDFVPCRELAGEVLHPDTLEEYGEIRSQLDLVASAGRRDGIEIHAQIFHPGERRLSCTENVRRALFVSADGAVSPCVFANLPVSEATVIIDGVERPYQRLVFGNVNERSLATIWRSKSYSRFRQSFYSREVTRPCEGCAKLRIR